MRFNLTREKHILKWTIRKLVKMEMCLSSETNENTPIDLIKIEVDPLYSLSIGSRNLFASNTTANHKYFQWDLYRTIYIVQ